MRGSAYAEIEIWTVGRRGGHGNPDIMYGHSAVGEMNSNYQRESAFQKSINQAVKAYRIKYHLDTDDEVNYHLIDSGILNVEFGDRRYYKNRIRPSVKRKIHKEIFLGVNKYTTREEIDSYYAEHQTGKYNKKKTQKIDKYEPSEKKYKANRDINNRRNWD